MLNKSRRALTASALALAVAGGASAAVMVTLSSSPASETVTPAALPSLAGPAATANVPRGAGSADGSGTGSAGTGSGAGTAEPAGQPGSPAPGSAPAASGPAGSTPGAARTGASPEASPLARSAGQGDPGPLAAGAVPADGAVPGASPALQALAAARATVTKLPHSPKLLGQLAATAAAPAASPASAAGSSASAAAARTLPGLDVAAFQHPVSQQHPAGAAIAWASVFKAGYKFTAVKATEGDYYVNPYAAADLAQAKAAGLDVTPYHFAVPNVSAGAAQARFAVEYSGYLSGKRTLPLMLDIEYDPYTSTDHANECYGLTAKSMVAWLGGFTGTVKSLTGQYPLIYTTADWWQTCTGGSTAFSADPMWVAAYGFTSPPVPAGWHAWTYWQYSSVGTVPGVATTAGTDLDSFSPGLIGLINPGSLSSRTGTSVWFQLSSLGAAAGEPLTYQASGLPKGLSLHAGGTISGKVTTAAAPKTPATYTVTVAARTAAGTTATVKFAWRIVPG